MVIEEKEHAPFSRLVMSSNVQTLMAFGFSLHSIRNQHTYEN